ncbi:MAG TPA: prepilin-type N-terminal cleavage/methylation domain-containing protein [Candidatus Methylomirabilis sp.]|nr:prepilin-type N-terminal cleavage/methylation domain-containing protein [Candidatus Methylomirabilis sp.]
MSGRSGYTLTELAIVLALIGTLTALATPSFLTYYQASRLRVGAEEVAALINQGRQLGIRQNVGTCVHITSTAVQYRLGTSCDAAAWLGPGTDASGNLAIPSGITLAASADPIFNYLGASNRGGTITVTNTQNGSAVHVTVAVSGRVTIGP